MLCDSAAGDPASPGRRNTLAGCEMLVNKVILRVIVRPVTPSPSPSGDLQPALTLHTEHIASEFFLCLRWKSDLGFVCPLREVVVVNLQATMPKKSARTPSMHRLFLFKR